MSSRFQRFSNALAGAGVVILVGCLHLAARDYVLGQTREPESQSEGSTGGSKPFRLEQNDEAGYDGLHRAHLSGKSVQTRAASLALRIDMVPLSNASYAAEASIDVSHIFGPYNVRLDVGL